MNTQAAKSYKFLILPLLIYSYNKRSHWHNLHCLELRLEVLLLSSDPMKIKIEKTKIPINSSLYCTQLEKGPNLSLFDVNQITYLNWFLFHAIHRLVRDEIWPLLLLLRSILSGPVCHCYTWSRILTSYFETYPSCHHPYLKKKKPSKRDQLKHIKRIYSKKPTQYFS